MSLRRYEAVMNAAADPTRTRILGKLAGWLVDDRTILGDRERLAEGIARFLAPPGVTVSSAGSEPAFVRPQAIQVLEEIGIDISANRSQAIDEVDAVSVEAVVTLCAEEVCPIFLGSVSRSVAPQAALPVLSVPYKGVKEP